MFSLITNTCEKLWLLCKDSFGKLYVHYSIDYEGNNSQSLF